MGVFNRRRDKKKPVRYYPDTWEEIRINGLPPDGIPGYDGIYTAHVYYKGTYYSIPVGEDGYVLPEDLVRRFYEVTGTNRNTKRDKAKDAKNIIKYGDGLRPEDIVQWWADPSSCDIQKIDDRKHELIAPEYPMPEDREDINEHFYLSREFSRKEREAIRKVLNTSFSLDELEMMVSDGSITVDTADVVGNGMDAGSFLPYTNKVVLRRKSIEPHTITHEFTHALKYHDPRRDRAVTRSQFKDYMDLDVKGDENGANRYRNLEEAATELETRARITPYEIPQSTGYYSTLGETIIGKGADVGLTGESLVGSIEQNFDKSHISKLHVYGDESARMTARRLRKTERRSRR